MSTIFETLQGVLLAVPDGLTPATVTACENSLLLAWLAANKADNLPKFENILGQIGWAVARSGTTQSQIDVGTIGATIEGAVSQDGGTSPNFGTVLKATGGTANDLAAAWWANGGLGRILATVTEQSQPLLHLVIATVQMPDPWRAVFDPAAQASVTLQRIDMTLNTEVYDKIATDIGTKVAPYRKDILKYQTPT